MEGEEQNGGWSNFSSDSGAVSGLTDNNQAAHHEILRRQEKFRSILVIVVGLGSMLFGLLIFYFNLTNPFSSILAKAAKDQAIIDEQARLALVIQQTQDTDQDGLTDYLELNQYSTSPYIADTDSDGISDGDEVKRGSDPNCAEGQTCFAAGADNSTSTYVAPTLTAGLVTQSEPKINASFIRDIMKQSGMTDAEVNALSDSEIMAEFATYLNDNPDVAKTLADQGYDFSGLPSVTVKTIVATSTVSVAKPTATTTATKIVINSLDDLNNLSAAQIRQWLIESDKTGKLAASLVNATDEQIKALVLSESAKLKTNNQ